MRKECTFVISLFLSLFIAGIFIRKVYAEDQAPKWLQNLYCDSDNKKFRGVEYCTGKGSYSNVHVIVVDLHDPAVRFEYLIVHGEDKDNNEGICKDVNRASKNLGGPGCDDPNERQYYPTMSLDEAVEQAKVRFHDPKTAVVINGDYSACTMDLKSCGLDANGNPKYREHGPEDLTVVAGERLDGIGTHDGDDNAVQRPWLALSKDPPLRAVIGKLESDDGSLPYDWVYTGMGGAPQLIKDGDVVEWEISYCYHAPGSCYDGASQTAVGISQDERWLFLVLGVKQKTLLSLAQFMHGQLDVYQAIKFDGGGSSKLWYDERVVVPGDARELTNYLVVLSESGSGVTQTPEVPPEESPQPSGENLSLRDRVTKWWQSTWIYKTGQKISELATEVKQAVEDFQELNQNIQDPSWWEEQLGKLLGQCCGSAALPALAVVTLVSIHAKRKRRG